MKNKNRFHSILVLFLIAQFSYSQVDVVYNDLVWSDEFDTNGPVNANKWFQQTQLPAGGSWYNSEVQHYTNLTTNSFVTSGLLNIVAIKENYTNQGITKAYTSARLNSKFAFKYGRMDVRAKLPIVAGTWPAIWMLGKNVYEDGAYFNANYGTTSWPACGEIDIMEYGIFPSQPTNYVQSTLHTPSSSGNSVNFGGVLASDLQNNYHVYSLNWSPFQISFLLDGIVYYTYNPSIKNESTWPFDKEQYLLLNIAMGGNAGAPTANFTQAKMEVDYVRVYQNTTTDTQIPTNFTATVGAVSGASVELLLNATDNSGIVSYSITYGGTTINLANASGIQKLVAIPNLTPNTNYSFAVTATDLAGNTAVNSPITLHATTTATLGCSGTDTQAQQGSFSIGYKYAFETIGTDVKINFELLDTDRVGVVAFLWKQSPFGEVQMTSVSGNIFTKTITGQTLGATINYAVKFAFAGGLAVTKYFSYVVGDSCSLGIVTASELNQFSFQNPAKETLKITSNSTIDRVEIYNLLGKSVLATTEVTTAIPLKNIPKGMYLLAVYSGNLKTVKKLLVE